MHFNQDMLFGKKSNLIVKYTRTSMFSLTKHYFSNYIKTLKKNNL